MGRPRTPISDSEKLRRAQQRAQSLAAVERLLYTRRQTAKALGDISIATVLRLEARGVLDKIRLAGSDNGAVFHRAQQVHALVEGGGVSSPPASTISPRKRRPRSLPDSVMTVGGARR